MRSVLPGVFAVFQVWILRSGGQEMLSKCQRKSLILSLRAQEKLRLRE
jgi:hypothetical protein